MNFKKIGLMAIAILLALSFSQKAYADKFGDEFRKKASINLSNGTLKVSFDTLAGWDFERISYRILNASGKSLTEWNLIGKKDRTFNVAGSQLRAFGPGVYYFQMLLQGHFDMNPRIGTRAVVTDAINVVNAYSDVFKKATSDWVFFPAQSVYSAGNGYIWLSESSAWLYAEQFNYMFDKPGTYNIDASSWYVYRGQNQDNPGFWAGTYYFKDGGLIIEQ